MAKGGDQVRLVCEDDVLGEKRVGPELASWLATGQVGGGECVRIDRTALDEKVLAAFVGCGSLWLVAATERSH